MNLFDDRSTSLTDCTNFRVSIEPKMFGKIDVVLPRHQEFTLTSNAADTYSTITFKFDDVYVVNQVTFGGWPTVWEDSGTYGMGTSDWAYEHEIRNPYLYILEVSKDGASWSAVIDHSICKCYCIQDLFFPRHAARYVRTYVSMCMCIQGVSFGKEAPPKLRTQPPPPQDIASTYL